MNRRGTAAAAIGVLLMASAAGGAPLNLSSYRVPPDITSAIVQVNYTSADGHLTATGIPTFMDADGVPPSNDYAIAAGQWAIDMYLEPDTGMPLSGSLTITGTIAALGATSGTLLTADIERFGFLDGGGDPFEFLFNVAGGDLAMLYGPSAGVTLWTYAGFTGNFQSDFNNIANMGFLSGVADTFGVVPEPATVLGVLLGAGGLAGYLRRRTRRRLD